MEKKRLTVGEIPFTNCFPIYYHLRHKCRPAGVRYASGAPAALNEALRRGELDLCISSSVEYARHPERYLLLPRFCIGSVEAIWSIRLFSRLPLERLDRKTVMLTTESDTSVLLCRIILGRFMGFRNEFASGGADLEEALEDSSAVLLIGDRALAADTRAAGFYSYDLGSIWHERTGLPFVFALWILRRDAAASRAAELGKFWRALCEAHRSAADPDEEMLSSGLAAKPFMTRRTLAQYWRLISYELSGEHLEGLKLFYRLGNEMGLLGPPPEMVFYYP